MTVMLFKTHTKGFPSNSLRKAKDKEIKIICFKEDKNNASHNYSIKLVLQIFAAI